MHKTLVKPLVAGLSLALLAGCATSKNKADTNYVARDVSTLYTAAKYRLDRRPYKLAAALFDEGERPTPHSPLAQRPPRMKALTHSMARHPTHPKSDQSR